MNALTRINDQIHAPPPSTTADAEPPALDQEFRNHQNFCAHVELYLTLRYAIKHADIGLLRRALRQVMMMFQAESAGTPNYAQVLLRVLHMTDSPAATLELQDAILANSLVNLRGNEDSNYETDRLLELLNNNLKTFQRERSFFSKNSDKLLEDWAMNGPYLLEVKAAVEFMFGRANSSKHSAKSAAEDIWSMALQLASKSLVEVNGNRFSMNPTVNLYMEGLARLGESSMKYNRHYISETVPLDDHEKDVELGLANETSEAPESLTLPASTLEPSGGMFVD